MTIYSTLFYILAAVILASTAMAVSRRNLVHAVIYLVFSFFGSALLFYLFGAPLLAALEVIIYAGAIMILFLFIVMMLRMEGIEERLFPLRQWLPAMGVCFVYGLVLVLLITADTTGTAPMTAAAVDPSTFGQFLFQRHWLAVEIVSMLLLIALVGVLRLGKDAGKKPEREGEVRP
ncbi:NADH-quinone oxidoreductase subunit J family protein [Desulfococcus multivorans]|jgi:NADH-quinone oxidoreductase subunit J|uniref:NADH-quinone oxidoreductase subunit J n=2 Tax=Desulfococcus TaxID=896 RepID=S7V4M2_DESML|nr:NADH-quinone oxidoreductase subunit J [Desulfococcus multivorans]AOY58596.1 NuoJ: NADH quinone oxidoreductase, subunit J [Desulfococcus multivorans]AQV02956.2 NADH-ubiquinone/plastoquinone oxidoreductase subunit 6 [Desulfococcus multivorans]EPR41554.1 NADH-ubiquinone/plastoquinone oxidoreductase chain 6 [Desulfococcus multivorans DSM 2059]SJZ44268.1 NADH dehydrogenase subunit J [Desulfococcus multivorans DSM 2059]